MNNRTRWNLKMNREWIWIVLALALFSIGCCEAVKDCFYNEYTQEISFGELKKLLGEKVRECKYDRSLGLDGHAIDRCIFRETARLLAHSGDKRQTLLGSVTIEDLLEFTIENLTPDATSCKKSIFNKYDLMCQKFEDDHYGADHYEALNVYCEEGVRRLRKSCRKLLLGSQPYYEKLLRTSNNISYWKDPQRLDEFFTYFEAIMSPERRKEFMSGCCELIGTREHDHLFDFDGYADEEDVLRERCDYLKKHSRTFPIEGIKC